MTALHTQMENKFKKIAVSKKCKTNVCVQITQIQTEKGAEIMNE